MRQSWVGPFPGEEIHHRFYHGRGSGTLLPLLCFCFTILTMLLVLWIQGGAVPFFLFDPAQVAFGCAAAHENLDR
jgi:hypothetical protein